MHLGKIEGWKLEKLFEKRAEAQRNQQEYIRHLIGKYKRHSVKRNKKTGKLYLNKMLAEKMHYTPAEEGGLLKFARAVSRANIAFDRAAKIIAKREGVSLKEVSDFIRERFSRLEI